jgi:hypothetical protein
VGILFLRWANQTGSLPKKKKVKKVGLIMRHPQLINMKQNKYPPVYIESSLHRKRGNEGMRSKKKQKQKKRAKV